MQEVTSKIFPVLTFTKRSSENLRISRKHMDGFCEEKLARPLIKFLTLLPFFLFNSFARITKTRLKSGTLSTRNYETNIS
jgi:hypothetical protein